MVSEIYLQRAWSDAIDNPTIKDIKIIIAEIQKMDEEHGTFWVGVANDEEFILEANKDLTVVGIFGEELNQQFKSKFKSWSDIELLYEKFLSQDFQKVKDLLEENNI